MHSNAHVPFRKHVPWKLVVVALFFACVLVVMLMSPAKHDPLWWKHAGIPSNPLPPGEVASPLSHDLFLDGNRHVGVMHAEDVPVGGVKRGRDGSVPHPAARQLLNSLKSGVDFFADYDITKVVPRPDPPLTKEHPAYIFHYMNESTSKWPLRYVSNEPRIAFIPEFLTDEECDALVRMAEKKLVRSEVAPPMGAAKHAVASARTSSQTWLSLAEEPVKSIAARIFELTTFNLVHSGSSEMLQILRYENGQKYEAHEDYFDPKKYGPQKTNRAATIFLYLSDVEEGGHTWFPRADGKGPTSDFTSCNVGFGFKPRKRTIVVFYDMKPNGEYDDSSLHGGCPVKKGVKWGGTLWLRIPV